MGGKHFQQIHTNAGGGSQSGAGRDFGSQEEVGGKVSAEILEHRERNLQATALSGRAGRAVRSLQLPNRRRSEEMTWMRPSLRFPRMV